MKVKCINSNSNWLTIGKIYEVFDIDDDGNYKIIDDTNDKYWYYKKHFKPLSELRNEKIDKLLAE